MSENLISTIKNVYKSVFIKVSYIIEKFYFLNLIFIPYIV
jgi:hypothetical protein